MSEGGSIVGIYTATAAGAPMVEHRRAKVIAGEGLESDRYALGSGHWSDWPDPAGKAITLIALEVLAEVGMAAEQVRRNVVTKGMSLEHLIGVQFQLGSAVCFGIRVCSPCRYLEETTRADFRSVLSGARGGLRADVLFGGEIAVGDPIYIVDLSGRNEIVPDTA